jgi:L-seryl-tRNA(Ser) seleniumtransferase
MRIPPVLKDLFPTDSVKQWMDLVSQPNLVNSLREAAQQMGWKENWASSQLQNSVLQAKKWLDVFQDQWQSRPHQQLKVGINATGKIFSNRWSTMPLSPSTISMQAYLNSGFSDSTSLLTETEALIKSLTSAESVLVTQRLENAIWLVGQSLPASQTWALPRADCIRLSSGADLAALLSRPAIPVLELGASNVCSEEDYRQASESSVGGFFFLQPTRLVGGVQAIDRAQLAKAREAHGRLIPFVDLLLNGSLIDLSSLGLNIETASSRLQHTATATLMSGDGWIGGPACGLMMGDSAFVEPLRAKAQQLGLVASPWTLATLQSSILDGRAFEDWKKTPLGAIATNSIENLGHRAQRLAIQLEGLAGIRHAEHGQADFAIADSPLEGLSLPSGFVKIHLDSLSTKRAQEKLKEQDTPIWCEASDSELIFVLRTMDPAEDFEFVQILERIAFD